MSSPFSSSEARVVANWTIETRRPSGFVPYNPFGAFFVDLGYGSGGYGDLPYGQGVLGKVTFSTEWTKATEPSPSFTSVDERVVPEWVTA